MTKIIQESAILAFASAEDFKNPYLKIVKFVFADDKPNLNQQAIPYEEFANLKASAVGMPIKMRFLGRRGGAGNHDGSIPIGHISDITEDTLEDGTHRLIAEGCLYADEYPDIVEYLEEAYAANEAPGISWELSYHDSFVERGITFLKGVIARAATFVKHPAYGKRTALLALASDASITDEELTQQVVSLFAKEPDNKGGTNNVTLEEALAKIAELQAELDKANNTNQAAASTIAELEATASRVEELEAMVAERDEAIAEYQKHTLIAERTQKAVEAGIELDTDAEKLAQRQELWASMSEEVFTEMLAAVAEVAKKVPAKKTEASARPTLTLPRISVDTSSGAGVSTASLRERFRGLNRPEDSTEE